jgi:hypothetical protein
VSLILEALRKLERDKPAPDRGVVVMTTGGLSGRGGRAPGWGWLLLGIAGGLFTALAILEWRRPEVPPGGAPTAAAPAASAPPRSLPPTRPAPSPAASAARVAAPGPAPAAPASAVAARSMAAPAATAPSPSATPGTPDAPAAPALTLHAITVQDGQPVALINDRILREGDEIDGVRVLRIGEAEVEIERAGQRAVLRF